ncbi:MAG: lipopolysaccharide kinase InaA family protein, partial [Gemmataceae bacterium]
QNLVLLNRFFQLRATRTDRARFWHAYRTQRTVLIPEPAATARSLEEATLNSNARFWCHRMARYRSNNRQFRRVGEGATHGHSVTDTPPELIKKLLADPLALFADADAILKDSPSATVARVTIVTPTGPRAMIYKRFRIKQPGAHWRHLVRPSAARRSWLNGHNLLDRGLPTPRPWLVLERFVGGVPHEGFLLTEFTSDARPLSAVTPTPRLCTNLARLLRKMHRHRVRHRDLKAPNILVGPDESLTLIDLVGVTAQQKRFQDQERQADLARLAVSSLQHPLVRNTQRLQFLLEYLGPEAPAWKAWWRAMQTLAAAKIARNQARRRPLA